MAKRASILIITLWALLILSLFLAGVSYTARAQMGYARHLQDRAKLYHLARGGIEKALIELKNREESKYTAFNQQILNDKDLFKNIPLGEGFITLSYQPYQDQDSEKLYGVQDESSRIDINSVSQEVIENILERIGKVSKEKAPVLAEAIIAWRQGTGNQELIEYYKELEPPYQNKGDKFEVLPELLLVRGMNKDIFSRIKEVVTVYDTQQVNINTASFEVLYALGLNERLSRRIVEYRRGSDAILGTESDRVFESTGNLRDIGFLFTEDSLQINKLITDNLIKTNSDTFRINSFGRLEEDLKANSRKIICVVKLKGEEKPKILAWHEN